MQFLGAVIAFAVNDPKNMDKKLFRGAGRRVDNMETPGYAPNGEQILPATPDMYEKWWE